MSDTPRPDGVVEEEALKALGEQGADSGILVARLHGEEYGLRVSEAREVLPVPPITPVPRVPPALRGVAPVRGRPVPVVDLGERLLGRPVDGAHRLARIIVVDREEEDEPLALLVSEVAGLLDGRGLPLREPPARKGTALPPGVVRGAVAAGEDRIIPLLDLDRVLEPGALARASGGKSAESG